jgi:hypothetical protein
MAKRDDYLPHYREDLMEKVAKVRQAILNLIDYDLDDLRDVSKEDYELIRLSVINSIKGEAIAYEEKSRQTFVEEEFLKPAAAAGLITYSDTSRKGKCDFKGHINGEHCFGLEVKGGEGNSVTLLSRPPEADFLVVWSHLDVMSNTPGKNMRSVLGRVVKLMVNRDEKREHVDCIVFYDKWYKMGIKKFKTGKSLPDVFLLPSRTPTKADPCPPVHDPISTPFLSILYRTIGGKDVTDSEVKTHIWLCEIKIVENNGVWYRELAVRNFFEPSVTLTTGKSTKAKIKPIDII